MAIAPPQEADLVADILVKRREEVRPLRDVFAAIDQPMQNTSGLPEESDEDE